MSCDSQVLQVLATTSNDSDDHHKEAAARFLTGQSPEQPTVTSLSALPNVDAVYQDEHEWVEPWKRGASILHIQLRRWCHLLVVAPLTANTLAKVSGSSCDNLLTHVIHAWDNNPTNRKRPLALDTLESPG